ncbi:MAG TPA: SRPBCC family protein [Myxococcota bacterium]|jgi:hypothetical protein
MIEGRGVAVIARSRADIIAFVTDLERYRRADWKIGRVISVLREGEHTIRMRHGGTLRGLPGPPVSLVMTLDDTGAHYRSDDTGLARAFLTFDGGFILEDTSAGVRVTHIERFRFHLPWRLVAEPWLRAWLQADVAAEMQRMKALLESGDGE